MTFKVGDRVRVKPGQQSLNLAYGPPLYEGQRYTVKEVTHIGTLRLEESYSPNSAWNPERFELVDPEVKVGDRVEVLAATYAGAAHGRTGKVSALVNRELGGISHPYDVVLDGGGHVYASEVRLLAKPALSLADLKRDLIASFEAYARAEAKTNADAAIEAFQEALDGA